MHFKLLKNKQKTKENSVSNNKKTQEKNAKSNSDFNKETRENNAISNLNLNEETRRKFILKGWIELNRKTTCTKKGTRGCLFGSQTPSKMDFSLGRSMVEMLGVLAIIGVLSIGGIAGYTIAMRRYRANEIINIAQKYAFILYENALAQSETFDCTDDFLDFADSGLGAMPSGLKSIEPSNGDFDVERDSYGKGHFCLIKKESGNLVALQLEIDSKELCQTIDHMMDQIEGSCQGEKYFTLISFYVE